MPSDFALDLFETPDGEHPPYDLRRAAGKTVAASGLEHVHVLNGVFMDVFLGPRSMFDRQRATARLWGDGHERFGATSVDDTARYAARAALDRSLPSGKFAVADQVLSFDDVTALRDLQNGRYPDIHPCSFAQFLRRALVPAGASRA